MPGRCGASGCTKYAVYGEPGGRPTRCKAHTDPTMVDVKNPVCCHDGCRRRPSYNFDGRKAAYCHKHKAHGMVNTVSRRCATAGCGRQPIPLRGGMGRSRFCRLHCDAARPESAPGAPQPQQDAAPYPDAGGRSGFDQDSGSYSCPDDLVRNGALRSLQLQSPEAPRCYSEAAVAPVSRPEECLVGSTWHMPTGSGGSGPGHGTSWEAPVSGRRSSSGASALPEHFQAWPREAGAHPSLQHQQHQQHLQQHHLHQQHLMHSPQVPHAQQQHAHLHQPQHQQQEHASGGAPQPVGQQQRHADVAAMFDALLPHQQPHMYSVMAPQDSSGGLVASMLPGAAAPPLMQCRLQDMPVQLQDALHLAGAQLPPLVAGGGASADAAGGPFSTLMPYHELLQRQRRQPDMYRPHYCAPGGGGDGGMAGMWHPGAAMSLPPGQAPPRLGFAMPAGAGGGGGDGGGMGPLYSDGAMFNMYQRMPEPPAREGVQQYAGSYAPFPCASDGSLAPIYQSCAGPSPSHRGTAMAQQAPGAPLHMPLLEVQYPQPSGMRAGLQPAGGGTAFDVPLYTGEGAPLQAPLQPRRAAAAAGSGGDDGYGSYGESAPVALPGGAVAEVGSDQCTMEGAARLSAS